MKIEPMRDDTRCRRTLVYEVSGVGKVEHPDYYPILGEVVKVDLDREVDRSRWEVDTVTLSGRRYIRNGTKLGESDATHYYTGDGVNEDPHMPEWLLALADKAYRRAEAERLGCTPPCPECGQPSTLADPLNPEQVGEYCPGCELRFDAGNGLRRIPGLYRVEPAATA